MEDLKVELVLDVNEKPTLSKWALLSFQHVFAMFGATILVPFLTGLPVSVALFASGVGTLVYMFCTKFKVPVYLGSSFAYITAVNFAKEALGGDVSAAQTGLMLIGIVYVVVALIVKIVGTKWIDKLLPPVVIGPMIAVIGLGLSSNAVSNAGFVSDGDFKVMLVAIITFFSTAIIQTKAKGFFKIIPFLGGMCIGYISAVCFGLVDFSVVSEAKWFALPEFYLPFKTANFNSYSLYFGPETWAILPIAIVTISEHIGDHTVLGKICGKDFLKDPGLHCSLAGDGIATLLSALIGGPANTTYGENTGVIGLTRIASIYVTGGAAVIAILLSFCGKITALISTIPNAVLGGMCIILYGVIASNGLRVLVDAKVDFSKSKNIIVTSAMLVIGLGGAVFSIGEVATLSGTALAAIVGVVLNLILSDE